MMFNLASGILCGVAITLASLGVDAAELAAPNPALTPGAVVSTDREVACTFRDAPRLYQTARPVYFDQARQVFERYGIGWDRHRDYELDQSGSHAHSAAAAASISC